MWWVPHGQAPGVLYIIYIATQSPTNPAVGVLLGLILQMREGRVQDLGTIVHTEARFSLTAVPLTLRPTSLPEVTCAGPTGGYK